jgi:hypothetical protein
MAYFQNKNPNLGTFERVNFTAIWYILWLLGMHNFFPFSVLYQEKSGNPAGEQHSC